MLTAAGVVNALIFLDQTAVVVAPPAIQRDFHRVVDDGDLLTGGGVTSGIDLAHWLVEREFGSQLAHQIASRMEYAPARPAR